MRLSDLRPRFAQDAGGGLVLTLFCPLCQKHRVGVPVSVGVQVPGKWMVSSTDVNSLSLQPSILNAWSKEVPELERCPYHFSIVNGEIVLS